MPHGIDARRRALAGALVATAALARPPALAQTAPDLDTPFVTTPDTVVRTMLELAKLRAGERLLDLGSGDGRIVLEAARRGAIAHGVEIDPRLVRMSRDAAARAGLAARATFAAQDLFETDFGGVDVVTMYLLPDVNARLAPRLYATLRPGARIVSHDYGLGDWPADEAVEVDAPGKPVGRVPRSTVLRWTVPVRLPGRWSGQAGGAPVRLDIAQAWQHVDGTLHWDGRAHAFARRPVDGRALVLAVGDAASPIALHATATAGDTLVGELVTGRERRAVTLRRTG